MANSTIWGPPLLEQKLQEHEVPRDAYLPFISLCSMKGIGPALERLEREYPLPLRRNGEGSIDTIDLRSLCISRAVMPEPQPVRRAMSSERLTALALLALFTFGLLYRLSGR